MEENLAEKGVDIGNSEVNADEDIPNDKEIEIIEKDDEKKTGENDDNNHLNTDTEYNFNSK